MIEYAITAFRDISFVSNRPDSALLLYVIFGGVVIVVLGYWIKKTIGAFIATLSVLLAYLYFAG